MHTPTHVHVQVHMVDMGMDVCAHVVGMGMEVCAHVVGMVWTCTCGWHGDR